MYLSQHCIAYKGIIFLLLLPVPTIEGWLAPSKALSTHILRQIKKKTDLRKRRLGTETWDLRDKNCRVVDGVLTKLETRKHLSEL